MTFSLTTKDAVPEALKPACSHITLLAKHTDPKDRVIYFCHRLSDLCDFCV